MITRRTKAQLLVFAIITLLGVSYVGGRYAQLDRFVFDRTYTVAADFAESGGGIFAGAEVNYRGVKAGKVSKLEIADDGVRVHLEIDNEHQIPADTRAIVGNRSAVGEQYVELQPRSDSGPFLADGDRIDRADTRVPISTTTLLTNLTNTVNSVDRESLRTTVNELGRAFDGVGSDLQQIIDTSNSFIATADANFEVTASLIRQGNTVLKGQLDSSGSIRSFARDLDLFTGSLVGSDKDLRRVINRGSATVNQLRTFLEENRVDLSELLNNLVTTGEIVVKHLPGLEHALVAYPLAVEGGYTVVAKDKGTGLHNAHFGLILTESPHFCTEGYESTDRRVPQDGSNRPMNVDARCTEPPTKSNARGAQNAPKPRPATGFEPTVASFDPATGELRWSDAGTALQADRGTLAPTSFGEESWKWLYLQPLQDLQE